MHPRSFAAAALLLTVVACAKTRVAANDAGRATPTSASASRGAAPFAADCAACHGTGGNGGRIGPSLRAEKARKTHGAIRAIIVDPAPPMPKLYPAQLTEQDVDDVTAYVESL